MFSQGVLFRPQIQGATSFGDVLQRADIWIDSLDFDALWSVSFSQRNPKNAVLVVGRSDAFLVDSFGEAYHPTNFSPSPFLPVVRSVRIVAEIGHDSEFVLPDADVEILFP